MYLAIARTQWLWTRGLVGALSLLCFLTPVLAWQLGAGSEGATVDALLNGFSIAGPVVALIAALAGGFVLAVYPWSVDAEGRHVYALSLPIPWTQFLTARFATGALSLLAPTVALWIGGTVATRLVELPPFLRAYPGMLALRFFLAALLAYSASFVLQYVAGRRAVLTALVVLLGVVGGTVALQVLGFGNVVTAVTGFLFKAPGPFAIFSDPWMLIDV